MKNATRETPNPLRRAAATALALALLFGFTTLAAAEAPSGVVNVNQASVEQLAQLPRIGPRTAERIVEFREQHGPVTALDELLAVKGIGEKTLELIRPWARTNGETTLDQKVSVPRSAAKSASDDRS